MRVFVAKHDTIELVIEDEQKRTIGVLSISLAGTNNSSTPKKYSAKPKIQANAQQNAQPAPKKSIRRKVSAKTRRKLAEAMKKRWQAVRIAEEYAKNSIKK